MCLHFHEQCVVRHRSSRSRQNDSVGRRASSPFGFPALWICAFVLISIALPTLAFARDLRVCADPDNLPFSDTRQRGFENRIADLVARDLHAHLTYQWQRMGRGFVREYVDSGKCDLLIGIPSVFRAVLTTTPYYRSTYVFVTRRDGRFQLASLDDPALHHLKIGVQVLEEDFTPPATALARRGLQNEIVAFDDTGEDADSIVRAVADRKIDTAIVWGPLAGYFAQKFGNALRLTPLSPEVDPPALPFTFTISMGVRKTNAALREELEGVLQRHRSEIREILTQYGVPQLEFASTAEGAN
jgi:mxaJ protein